MAAKAKQERARGATGGTRTSTSTKKSAAAGAAGRPARTAPMRRGTALALTSVSPGFTVNDVEASLAWYRDVLGFVEGERWEHEGKLRGVELSAGKATFMLGQDDWKKGRDRLKGQGVRMYCETDQDVDRLAERIRERGGTLTQEPKDQPWGMRDIALQDPDGYNLTIATKAKAKVGAKKPR